MSLPSDKVVISVIVDREVKEVLEELAKEMEISVSRLARNALYVGLDEAKVFRRFGVFKLAKIVRTFKRNILNMELEKDDEAQE